MSFRRKKYDGDFVGGGISSPEWGNSFSDQSEIVELAPTKRTNRNFELAGEDIFAEDSDRDRYIITYADLITLLLGLFIILYAVSNIDIMKYEKMQYAMGSIFGKESKPNGIIGLEYQKYEIKNQIKELQELKIKLQQLILENNNDNTIKFEENERSLTIHIVGDVLFSPASSTLNEGAKDILKRITAIVNNIPNSIRVEGHSDNIPVRSEEFSGNWELSVTRALKTAEFLMEYGQLSPGRISIMGYADTYPLASNETPDGRAANRRVDIVVLK